MFKKKLLIIISVAMLMGCASRFVYSDKSVPIKKGVTRYHLGKVEVNLKLGTNGEKGENDTVYFSQKELVQEFTTDLKKYLKEYNIFDSTSSGLTLSAEFDFVRNFNLLGKKALNIPHFSHIISVKKGNKKVAYYSFTDYVINYSVVRNLKITASLSGPEDEKEDIDLVCKEIIEELKNLGD